MGRKTRKALLERATRTDRKVRRKPTSLRTVYILAYQTRQTEQGKES